MALIKQNIMGAFQGKMGSMTAYNAPAGNVARVRNNATNVGVNASRTELQQVNRVRWANLVNFYKASGDWMLKAFEGKLRKHSDYNKFMQYNFTDSTIALTKEEAAAGACVASEYVVSKGSIPTINVRPYEDFFVTDLRIGELEISDATTVAELSSALIANDYRVKQGMQLSFVSYQQTLDAYGVPRLICTAYEMRVDANDTEHVAYDYLPSFALGWGDGLICTTENISVGGFAYVLSNNKGGRVSVSSQRLIVRNNSLITRFSSTDQFRRAMISYGMNPEAFLESSTAVTKMVTPQPNSIETITMANGRKVRPMERAVTLAMLFGYPEPNLAKVNFLNALTDSQDAKITLLLSSGEEIEANIRGISGREARITMFSSEEPLLDLSVIEISYIQGATSASFRLPEPLK